jgi:hypothetical protein
VSDMLLVAALVAGWFVLRLFVLPKMGVPT